MADTLSNVFSEGPSTSRSGMATNFGHPDACLHSVSNFLADVSVAWSIVCSIAKARVTKLQEPGSQRSSALD